MSFHLQPCSSFSLWVGREAPGSVPGPTTKSLFLLRSDGKRMHAGGAVPQGEHEVCFQQKKLVDVKAGSILAGPSVRDTPGPVHHCSIVLFQVHLVFSILN